MVDRTIHWISVQRAMSLALHEVLASPLQIKNSQSLRLIVKLCDALDIAPLRPREGDREAHAGPGRGLAARVAPRGWREVPQVGPW